MAIIAMPSVARLRSVTWDLDRPAQVNRSGYTGRRTVVANPWHGRWSAKVELAPIVGEANVRLWRAFLAKLKGQINTMELRAVEGVQFAGAVGPVTVTSSAAAGAVSLVLTSSPALTAGMFATVTLPSGNKQLLVLVQDKSGSTISFEPPLREAVSAGAAVETVLPTCQVALAQSNVGWNVDAGQAYALGFEVEEAF